MPFIGVYGSLRRGCYNHRATGLPDQPLRMVVLPGQLYSLGAYPCLIGHPTDHVVGELYEVDDKLFESLDYMESMAGYEAVELTDGDDTFTVWYYARRPPAWAEMIEDGDWTQWLKDHKEQP